MQVFINSVFVLDLYKDALLTCEGVATL